jgi:glycosyltransferase involved in cell wall biosynthesis
MTLHSTIDPPHAPKKALKNLDLSKYTRLLVHSIADLNRLKDLGYVDNVTLFPHGVLDTNLTKSPSDEIVIATFGFFLPHKGLIETMEAFKILKEKYPKLKLKMLNSQYPIELSEKLIKQAKEHLVDGIDLDTRFLSDEEILQELNKADIVVFAYQNTNESASGAVRYAIALDKEIVITPVGIFDDIKDFCFVTKDMSIQSIAQTISEAIDALTHQTPTLKHKQTLRQKYLKTHRYSKLAKRLYNMCWQFVNS